MGAQMITASLAFFGSINAVELFLIAAAVLAVFGFRVPAVLLRWARRVERR